MGAGSSAASRQLHHSVMMAGRHGGTSDLVRSAERVIQLNPRLIIDPDPDQGTTMLWEASRRGHKETLVILKLLSKHCTSKEEFLNCLDWAHPVTQQNCLHVAADGRVIALLLLSGARSAEARELTKGMTPILFHTSQGNTKAVATLKCWGVSCAPRDGKIGANSDDHAHWLSYPRVEGSDVCLGIIRGTVDVAQYTGVQHLHSQAIIDELTSVGIEISNHQSIQPGGLKDHVMIDDLPTEDLRNKARLFDVDNSHSISYEELAKIDPKYAYEKYGYTADVVIHARGF